MGGARFSLRVLMVGVALVAVSIAALRGASAAVANGSLTVSVGLLLFGVVAAVCGRAEARGFWVGFSVFGWGYLVVSAGLLPDAGQAGKLATTSGLVWLHSQTQRVVAPVVTANRPEIAVWVRYDGGVEVDGEEVELEGVTAKVGEIMKDTGKSKVYLEVDPGVGPERQGRVVQAINRAGRVTSMTSTGTSVRPTLSDFVSVGHSLLAVLAGLVGGLMGRWLQVRKSGREVAG